MKHYHIVVICGSRDATEMNMLECYDAALEEVFAKLLQRRLASSLIVIEGGQRGVDNMAGMLAEMKGCGHVKVTASWDKYQKAAGPIRNGWMLALQPSEVYGVHHDLENSRGTLNCLTQADALGIKTIRVPVVLPKRASNRSSNPSIRKATRHQKS